MILSLINLILAIIGSGLTYYFTGLYQDLVFLWLPFVLIVAYWLALTVVYAMIFFLLGGFVNVNKDQERPNPYFSFSLANIAQLFLKMCFIKIKVIGKDKLPEKKPNNRFVIMTNHLSNFDHLILLQVLHRYKIVSITKPSLAKAPFLGGVMHASGFIPIDRDNAMRAMKAIRKAINDIKNDIASVAVAPEGTRSKTGQLGEFHPMTFMIATNSKAPLVIASIKGSEKIKKRAPFRPTIVTVEILKVYTAVDYENLSTKDIAAEAHEIIKENLGQ